MSGGRRIAVVLFNLGGPDDAASVRPFLFNLFNDPAIIGLPGLMRTAVARLISSRRESSAQANYALMDAGGGSPLLAETRRQAQALQDRLAGILAETQAGDEVRTFVCMRYWRPMTEEVAADVAVWRPDEVVLLPLYPQFSTTTTASSLKAWSRAYAGSGRSRTVCCYPQAPGWIEAQAQGVRTALNEAGGDRAGGRRLRILFSAHGIPEKLVKAGDPYQEQVETTVAAIVARLDGGAAVDHRICYQSRVGPLKWLGPSTPEAIAEAGRDGVGVVVVPVAFVSEHIETLVELDIEYAHLAAEQGVAPYLRTATVSLAEPFIDALAQAVVGAVGRPVSGPVVAPCGVGCRDRWAACPHQQEMAA